MSQMNPVSWKGKSYMKPPATAGAHPTQSLSPQGFLEVRPIKGKHCKAEITRAYQLDMSPSAAPSTPSHPKVAGQAVAQHTPLYRPPISTKGKTYIVHLWVFPEAEATYKRTDRVTRGEKDKTAT